MFFLKTEPATGAAMRKTLRLAQILHPSIKSFMDTAVQFGTGAVGRSLTGLLLHRAGYKVAFAGDDAGIVRAIASRRRYAVAEAGEGRKAETVDKIFALEMSDPELELWIAKAVLVVVLTSEVYTTEAATALARGIALRQRQRNKNILNIIVCGDRQGEAERLRSETCKYLGPSEREYAGKFTAFADSRAERRAVPLPDAGPADLLAEEYFEWQTDCSGLEKPYPAIPGMECTENLSLHIMRRSLVFGAGLATAAYVGHLKGCGTLNECMEDKFIRKAASGAMRESAAVLDERFGPPAAESESYVAAAMARLAAANPAFSVEAACAGPIKKLSPHECLVAPAVQADYLDLPFDDLAVGIAAALRYYNPADPESSRLQAIIAAAGIRITASEITGIDAGSRLMDAVTQAYRYIPYMSGKSAENPAEAPAETAAAETVEQLP